ncbi:MAG: UDP-2,4-diacetamido-2,4,6-trideoxy-beta-L-altropyranose hydrolase [Paracoccaceae bacterium]
MKTVVFRADSSLVIGTGHLMRCLTLADALYKRGVNSHFLTRDLEGSASEIIVERGFGLHVLSTDGPEPVRSLTAQLNADWLVVDNYRLDATWERVARPANTKVAVIDDLADRKHDCALLLDQNLGRAKGDYEALVSQNTVQLLGPEFAMLRAEFLDARDDALKFRAQPKSKNVLINFGGADPHSIASKTLSQLETLDDFNFKIILGGAVRNHEHIQSLAQMVQAEVITNTSNMAELMRQADVAIGAAGSTAWERCCLGLPTGMVILADNQRMLAHAIEDAGAGAVLADLTQSDDLSQVEEFLTRCQTDIGFLNEMSENAARLIDGKGVERVVDAMINLDAIHE